MTKSSYSHKIDVDNDWKLLGKIHEFINCMDNGELVTQIITSECKTCALIIYTKEET
jgi:hypothetical protein